MILLDTTVLLYAVGGEHALRDPCRAILSAVAEGLVVTTTPEVLQEFCHARSRRHGREDAVRLTERYAQLLAPLVTTESRDLLDALPLYADNERLGMFDSVMITVARNGGMSVLSADRAFGTVPDLVWLDPADPGVVAELVRRG